MLIKIQGKVFCLDNFAALNIFSYPFDPIFILCSLIFPDYTPILAIPCTQVPLLILLPIRMCLPIIFPSPTTAASAVKREGIFFDLSKA